MLHPSTWLITVFLLTCGPVLAQTDFELEEESDGVTVYVRPEANGEFSVRVETTVATDVAGVKAVLDDAGHYVDWVHRCDGAYIVEGGQPDDYVFVSGIDMPFPFRDKEIVARVVQYDKSDGTMVRSIVGEPGAVAPTSGRDRPGVYVGEWVVRPLTDRQVHVQVTVRTDAGNGVPMWLRKEIITSGPAKTVGNLRRLLEQRAAAK